MSAPDRLSANPPRQFLSPVRARPGVNLWPWALLLLIGGPAHAEAPCRPAVHLDGPAEVIALLADLLRQRGVDETPVEGCPLLRARVNRHA